MTVTHLGHEHWDLYSLCNAMHVYTDKALACPLLQDMWGLLPLQGSSYWLVTHPAGKPGQLCLTPEKSQALQTQLQLLLRSPATSPGFTILGEIFAYVTAFFFHPTMEVVTFHLHEWCIHGVFLFCFLPAFTHLRHECQDPMSLCDGMHVCTDQTLVYTPIRKSFGGMESELMLTPAKQRAQHTTNELFHPTQLQQTQSVFQPSFALPLDHSNMKLLSPKHLLQPFPTRSQKNNRKSCIYYHKITTNICEVLKKKFTFLRVCASSNTFHFITKQYICTHGYNCVLICTCLHTCSHAVTKDSVCLWTQRDQQDIAVKSHTHTQTYTLPP